VKEWNEEDFGKIQVPLDDSRNQASIRLLYSSMNERRIVV